ncbi:MAG: patatin-like phospholipase family protein [Planctomycetota bacterium]
MLKLCPSFLVGAFASILLILGACVATPRHQLPRHLAEKGVIPGFSGVRATAGRVDPGFQRSLKEATQLRALTAPGKREHALLALSGGGGNGAFSVGILNGWSKTGTRPEFDLVTGVSTGALIAPMAFLGEKYDALLRDEYTTITSDDIFVEKSLISLIGDDSLADSAPLAKRLQRIVTDEFLDEIAAAHQQGRRLYVGTTRLDTQQFVVWDMGAIASSKQPNRGEFFCQIMLASASVPTFFPPQYIEVEVDGETYDEMHVDGSVIANVFLHGFVLDLSGLRKDLGLSGFYPITLYTIRNSQIRSGWEPIPRKILPIAERSVMTLLDSGAVGDLYRIFSLCRRDGIEFRMVAIPPNFTFQKKEIFDQDDMKSLYKFGFERAQKANLWKREPPGWGTQSPPLSN